MDLCIVHIFECCKCDNSLLIRDDVYLGDLIICPRCGESHVVESVMGRARQSAVPATLEAEVFYVR